jgi:hypothetical protein
MPTLSGLTSVEFDRVKVKKPEGGTKFNLFDVFVRRPEHYAHVTNGRFDVVDDTRIVTTNALTQYTAAQVYEQHTETVVLVERPLPMNTESGDLAEIKTLLQNLSDRVAALERAG